MRAERDTTADVFFLAFDVKLSPLRTRSNDNRISCEVFTTFKLDGFRAFRFDVFHTAIF
ncbi:hypothetical protein D3C87_1324610 [compost metagenome]